MMFRDLLLTLHFVGLIVGAGSGFALFVIGFLLPRFAERERAEIAIGLYTLRYMSYAGLLLLVVTGILMLQALWQGVQDSLWLWGKLLAVAIIVVCAVFGVQAMRRPRPDAAVFRRLALLGKISVAASLWVVICAVQSFH
ncbi:hypothetical protein NT239_10600 [Chitinibacter sp. SCUT-21]|uniref:hypothetical protein n=1 Tax=Chitinibacter sp. SCUT-21 TaxID=2970891 RepID=UPI0035A5855B